MYFKKITKLLLASFVSTTISFADTGYVEIYDLNDTSYINNLLENNVTIDDAGQYSVTKEDFKDSTRPDSGVPFVIRAIYTVDGTPYELSFAKLDVNATEANVTPKTAAATQQIMQTLSENFGTDISDVNFTEINEQFLKLKDNSVSLSNFNNNLTNEERKAKILLSLSQDDTAKKFVTALKQQVAEQKKEQLSSTITALSKNFDPETQTESVARITYGVVSNFAYMGLSVHNGNGKVIAFLPTPAEKVNTLPGVPYSFVTYDSIQDKNVTIGGNDPQLRLIDPTQDLVSLTGYEPWAFDLKEKLSDSPVVPFNVIKLFVKNFKETKTLEEFGDILASVGTPADVNVKLWSGINPFVKLDGKVLSQNNPEQSVQSLIESYGTDIIANSLDFIANDLLNKEMATGSATDFLSLFSSGSDANGFVQALANHSTNPLEHLANELSIPLMGGIPFSNKSDNAIKFSEDGFTIDVNTTTVTPASAMGLVNLVMSANPFNEATLVKQQMDQVMPWFFNGFTPDALYGEDSTLVWWPQYNDTAFSGVSSSVIGTWNKNLILTIANAFGNGETVSAEGNYANTIGNVKSALNSVSDKIEQNQYLNEFDTEFFTDFGNNDYKDTSLKINMYKFDNTPNTKINGIILTPIYENIVDGVRNLSDENNITLALENGSWKATGIRLYKDSIELDKQGEPLSGGKNRQFGMFKVTILEAGESYEFGEFPLFPIDENDLGTIYFDTDAMYNESGEFGNNGAGEFDYKEYTIGDSSRNMFYPSFFKSSDDTQLGEDIMTFDGHIFTIVTGDAKKGTLTDATFTLSKLADNYNTQENIWEDNNFTHTSSISSIDIDNTSEGALYRMSVNASALKSAELLINIDWKEDDKFGISIYPVPGSENRAGGSFDFDKVPQELILTEDFTTNVKFKITKYDGVTPNYDVSTVIFTPELKSDFSLANDQNITFTNPQSGEFENSVTLKPTYTGMFNVTVSVLKDDLTKENISIGYFPLFANQENNLDRILFESYGNDGTYAPAMTFPMHPENTMNTTVNLKIVFNDPSTNNVIVNQGVVKIRFTPILENSSTYNRMPQSNLSIELDHGSNGATGSVTLEPFEDKFNDIGESGTTHHYTGDFDVDVIMDDAEEFYLGTFPLFANEINNLGNFFFEGKNNFTVPPHFTFAADQSSVVDVNLTESRTWYSLFTDEGRFKLAEITTTTSDNGISGNMTYEEFSLDDSDLNQCTFVAAELENATYAQDTNSSDFNVNITALNEDIKFVFKRNQLVTHITKEDSNESISVDFTMSEIDTFENDGNYSEMWFTGTNSVDVKADVEKMIKLVNGCNVTP